MLWFAVVVAAAAPAPVVGEVGLDFVEDDAVPTQNAQGQSTRGAIGIDGRGTLWTSINSCLPRFTEAPADIEELNASGARDGLNEPAVVDVDSSDGGDRAWGVSMIVPPGFGTGLMEFAAMRCRLATFQGGAPFPVTTLLPPGRVRLESDVLPEDLPKQTATSFGAPERLCWLRGRPDPHVVECLDPLAPSTNYERFLDAADVAAVVVPRGFGVHDDDLGGGPGDAPTRVFLVDAVRFDGHVWGIAQVDLGPSALVLPTASARFVVDDDGAGTVVVRFGPVRAPAFGQDAFFGLSVLPSARAVVMSPGPLPSLVTQRRAYPISVDSSQTLLPPYGARLALFPVDGDPGDAGSFDLVRATRQLVVGNLERPDALVHPIEGPGGGLWTMFPLPPGAPSPLVPWQQVVVDLDGGDADKDGLSGADEAALGTSPWQRDSDGDGAGDGFEAFVADSDPTTAATPPGAPDVDDRGTYSPLVSLRLAGPDTPDLTDVVNTMVSQPFAAGLLCGRGSCRDIDNNVVVEAADAVLYADAFGDSVVFDDGQNVRRRFVDGRDDEVLAQTARVKQQLLTDIGRLVPAADGRIYAFAVEQVIGLFGSTLSSHRIVVIDGADVRPLFTPVARTCVLTGDCTVDEINDPDALEYAELTHFVGYDDGLDALYVTFCTRDDIQLLAIAKEGAPVVVARVDDYQRVFVDGLFAGVAPITQLLSSSDGHQTLFFATGVNDGFLSGGFLVDQSLQLRQPISDGGFLRAPHAAFGRGALVQASFYGEKLIELFPSPRAIAPGDVLFAEQLPSQQAGVPGLDRTLIRVPPRGGAQSVVDGARDRVGGDIVALGAADPDAGGRVCAVVDDGFARGVVEFSGGAVPDAVSAVGDFVDAVDCAYAGADLVVAAEAPPRLVVGARTLPLNDGSPLRLGLVGVRRGGGFFVTTYDDNGTAADPTDDSAGALLCVAADGAVHNSALGLVGVVESQDGTAWGVRSDDALVHITGDVCGDGAVVDDRGAGSLQATLVVESSGVVSARVLERRDGLLVVFVHRAKRLVNSRLLAYDRRTHSGTVLAYEVTSTAPALVPGGDLFDPWQDERRGDPAPRVRGVFFDGDPDVPLPGDEDLVDPPGPSPAAGGCTCAGVDGSAVAAVWSLLALLRRRRR